jgi:hypothetical protein
MQAPSTRFLDPVRPSIFCYSFNCLTQVKNCSLFSVDARAIEHFVYECFGLLEDLVFRFTIMSRHSYDYSIYDPTTTYDLLRYYALSHDFVCE